VKFRYKFFVFIFIFIGLYHLLPTQKHTYRYIDFSPSEAVSIFSIVEKDNVCKPGTYQISFHRSSLYAIYGYLAVIKGNQFVNDECFKEIEKKYKKPKPKPKPLIKEDNEKSISEIKCSPSNKLESNVQNLGNSLINTTNHKEKTRYFETPSILIKMIFSIATSIFLIQLFSLIKKIRFTK